MSRPVYWQGPPVAEQTNSTSRPRRRGMSVLKKRPLIRLSAATRVRNSSTTASTAGLPPKRSNSGLGGAAGAGGACAAGAAGGGVPPPDSQPFKPPTTTTTSARPARERTPPLYGVSRQV